MSKATKGPWQTRSYAPLNIFKQTENGLVIVAEASQDFDKETNEANSHLIASAPDLLEACKLALVSLETGSFSVIEIDVLRRVITKAEGGK